MVGLSGIGGRINGLTSPKRTEAHINRFGHRVIYVPSYICPWKKCPTQDGVCSDCGAHFNKKLEVCYDNAKTVSNTNKLTKNSPNPYYQERLDHRWLVSVPTVTWKNEFTGAEGTAEYKKDFVISGRCVQWLEGNPLGEGDWVDYEISYTAYAEDTIFIHHTSSSTGSGLPTRAESNNVYSAAQVDQGYLAGSIPASASCYNLSQGDFILPVDGTMSFTQELDTSLPDRNCRHRFISKVDQAFYSAKLPDGKRQNIAVEMDFDFLAREWVVPDYVPKGAIISIRYTAAPSYTVFLDAGEFRAPVTGDQPRLIVLVREEISL